MRILVAIAALIPAIALAQERAPCSFAVGHASLSGESKENPIATRPDWFIVSGSAQITISGRVISGRLFDSRSPGELSHTLRGTLANAPAPVNRNQKQVTLVLRTMGTDSGDDTLTGTYLIAKTKQHRASWTIQSLIAHNPFAFVAIYCHAPGAT